MLDKFLPFVSQMFTALPPHIMAEINTSIRKKEREAKRERKHREWREKDKRRNRESLATSRGEYPCI